MNSYTPVCAKDWIDCSAEQARRLQAALLHTGEDEGEVHNLEATYKEYQDGGQLLLWSEDLNVLWIPDEALQIIGEIISAANALYLEMGLALTSDKFRAGSHGGGYFRFMRNGSIEDPAYLWPSGAAGPFTRKHDAVSLVETEWVCLVTGNFLNLETPVF